jgi:leucyl aminopeptidase
MTNSSAVRRISLRILFLFAVFSFAVAGYVFSGSEKTLAQTKDGRRAASSVRWLTVAENEVEHVESVMREKDDGFALKFVEKRGELAIIEADERQILDLSRNMHEEFHKCAGFTAHATLADAEIAAEEAERAESLQPSAVYTIDNQTNVNALLGETKEAQILETITRLSTDFPTRRYNQPSGLDSANWIKNKWTQIAAGRSDITVEFFDHTAVNSPQPSVILTVQGTTLPNEVVVLGGHQDSINLNGPSFNAPGADDDASGIASLTEALRVLVAKNFRPQRTVKFMAYAAEEIGLVGSNQIAADFQARGVNVVGVLQLDMTNYKSADSVFDIAIITDRTNAAQNQFIRDLITTYQPSLAIADATCGYGCSDHSSWTSKGFAASFPFEPRSNPTIHTTSDTLAQSSYSAAHAAKYTKIAVSYIGELAKGAIVAANYTVSGKLTKNGAAVAGATVYLNGTTTRATTTDAVGNYAFTVNPNENFTITLAKTGSVNGINSLDAARIQQYLVGLTTLSAAQSLAADTDNNGIINSLDATRIQQYLVGIPSQNIIGQWKFLPSIRQYNALSANLTGENFEAVLVGEVSGDWNTSALSSDWLKAPRRTGKIGLLD